MQLPEIVVTYVCELFLHECVSYLFVMKDVNGKLLLKAFSCVNGIVFLACHCIFFNISCTNPYNIIDMSACFPFETLNYEKCT